MPADPNNKIKAFQIIDKLVIWTVYTDLFLKKKGLSINYFIHVPMRKKVTFNEVFLKVLKDCGAIYSR